MSFSALVKDIKAHAGLRAPSHETRRLAATLKASIARKKVENPATDWPPLVKDLHRVMAVARNLFLIMSDTNECVMRVALEIITSKRSAHIFKWMDDWYDDDERRTWFEGEVQEQLRNVLDIRTGEIAERLDSVPRVDLEKTSDALNVALKRAEAAEGEVEMLQQKLKQIVGSDDENEDEGGEVQQQLQAKERQIINLKEKLREANAEYMELEDDCKALKEQLEKVQKGKKEADTAVQQARAKLSTLETEAGSMKDELKAVQPLQEELARLKGRQAEVQNREEQMAQEIEKQKAEARAEALAEGDSSKLRKLEEKNMELRRILQGYGRRMSTDSGAQTGGFGSDDEEDGTQAGGSMGRLEREKYGRKIKDLNMENKRLKVVVEELQQKLREFTDACQEEGVDISSIVDKLNLRTILQVNTVWERLYDEAKQRVQRMEQRRRDFYNVTKEDMFAGANLQQMLESSDVAKQMHPHSSTSPILEDIAEDPSPTSTRLPSLTHTSPTYASPPDASPMNASPVQAESPTNLYEQASLCAAQHHQSRELASPPPAKCAVWRGGGVASPTRNTEYSPTAYRRTQSEVPTRMQSQMRSTLPRLGRTAEQRMQNALNPQANSTHSGEQLRSISGLRHKSGHPSGVYPHNVPRREHSPKRSRGQMNSSLGFSKATHVTSYSPKRSRGQMNSSLGFSKATHVTSYSPKRSRGQMNSSMGFSKATHITSFAQKSDSLPHGGNTHQTMRSSKGLKGRNRSQQRALVDTVAVERMTSSMPSLGTEAFAEGCSEDDEPK